MIVGFGNIQYKVTAALPPGDSRHFDGPNHNESNQAFPDYPAEVWQRAGAIRLLILDVDGVLTDGRLYFDAKGETLKVFHVRDGHGIKMAQRAGIEVAMLSGRRSDAAYHRAKELGINRFFEGLRDKVATMKEIKAALNIRPQEVAVVGDDLVDLPIMSRAGPGGGGGRRRPGGA